MGFVMVIRAIGPAYEKRINDIKNEITGSMRI